MIPIEHLHVLDVIHREGSFSKASERLFKARSAVSYSVKKVEEYYQIEIFDRTSYRPKLTRDGEILMLKISHLMRQFQQFDDFAKQMNTEVESELKIGISAIFPTAKVTALLRHLSQCFPSTIINLNVETSSGERLLLDKKVEIGIYGALKQHKDVSYKQIDNFSIPVFVSDMFPVKANELTMQRLAMHPQVVLTASYKSGPTVGVLEDGVQWYVSDHTTKKELIYSGLGWGRIPIHEVEAEVNGGKLHKVECCEDMTVPAYVAKLQGKTLGLVGQEVWQFFNLD